MICGRVISVVTAPQGYIACESLQFSASDWQRVHAPEYVIEAGLL